MRSDQSWLQWTERCQVRYHECCFAYLATVQKETGSEIQNHETLPIRVAMKFLAVGKAVSTIDRQIIFSKYLASPWYLNQIVYLVELMKYRLYSRFALFSSFDGECYQRSPWPPLRT